MKAKIFTRLFYRHWNAFTEFKRSHLFVIPADSGVVAVVSTAEPNKQALGTSASTTPRDLTPGDHDVPPFNLGGQDMYAISPDGQEVAYTSNIDEVEATSTNNEIFIVPISGPATARKKISTSPGADTTPLYSPDGKYLAWRSQARAGFEADKWRLLVQDRQRERRGMQPHIGIDRSAVSLATEYRSGLSLFTAEEASGESPIWQLLRDKQPMRILRSCRLHATELPSVIESEGEGPLFHA